MFRSSIEPVAFLQQLHLPQTTSPRCRHKYQPLAHFSDIRLVFVHSVEDFEDPPQFSMQHCKSCNRHHDNHVQLTELWNDRYRLEDQEGYYAMPYAWGTAPTTKVVTVLHGGIAQSLPVRRNVAEMLRHLGFSRHNKAYNEHWLWIDSVCITRTDLQEKESQVKQMGHIFASASRVLIWLGPRDVHSHNNDPESNGRYLDPMVCDLYPSIELTRRSWAHCRWVIREVALAREAFMMCGSSSSEFQEFVREAESESAASSTSLTATDKTVLKRLLPAAC
jgi:hypothetical protein